jgi:hypothetical protein
MIVRQMKEMIGNQAWAEGADNNGDGLKVRGMGLDNENSGLRIGTSANSKRASAGK